MRSATPCECGPASRDGGDASSGVRTEIQGLRTVAVPLVVAYHFWPRALPRGYIGVDVVFVISGFLITSHLLREVDRTGSLRLGAFWARRARRLLPASLFVVASAIATLLVVPATFWRDFFKHMGASVAYVLNWTLAFNAVDDVAAENNASPLQHYVSIPPSIGHVSRGLACHRTTWQLLLSCDATLTELIERRKHGRLDERVDPIGNLWFD